MGYEFTLVLDRLPSDDDLAALFDAGCSDAVFEVLDGDAVAHFVRKSDSLTHAISSAVHNVEQGGLRVSEVRRDEIGEPAMALQYAKEIAAANMMVQTRTFLASQRRG